jgi:hypothetical protein
VYNRKSIASHTNFYGCWDRSIYGNRNQEDDADYWKFKVANPGTYKMVSRDLQVAPHYGGVDQLACYPYLSLIETDGIYRKYLFEQLDLRKKSETPEFTLDPSKTYFLDLQLGGRHYIWSRYASFELDLRRTDFPQPWLKIQPRRQPAGTVCGVKEEYSAWISNNGEATAFTHVKLELYNTKLPQKKFTYRKNINLPPYGWDTQYLVTFKVTIPKTPETASGDWAIKWSAYDPDFRDSYVQRVESMEVLCRPLPLAALQLLLLGGF